MSSKQQIATAVAVQRIRWILAITIVWMTVEASISPKSGEAYLNYGMVMMETCRYADAALASPELSISSSRPKTLLTP